MHTCWLRLQQCKMTCTNNNYQTLFGIEHCGWGISQSSNSQHHCHRLFHPVWLHQLDTPLSPLDSTRLYHRLLLLLCTEFHRRQTGRCLYSRNQHCIEHHWLVGRWQRCNMDLCTPVHFHSHRSHLLLWSHCHRYSVDEAMLRAERKRLNSTHQQ